MVITLELLGTCVLVTCSGSLPGTAEVRSWTYWSQGW